MKIMPESQQKEIARTLRAYALCNYTEHSVSGLCYFFRRDLTFTFNGISCSYDFFDMLPIGKKSESSFIGGSGSCGGTELRREFTMRLAALLDHSGIYITSSKENGNFLKANGSIPGAKDAREKFFRWVKNNT